MEVMKLDPTERSLRTGGHSRLETVATATEVLLGYGQGRAFSPPPPQEGNQGGEWSSASSAVEEDE